MSFFLSVLEELGREQRRTERARIRTEFRHDDTDAWPVIAPEQQPVEPPLNTVLERTPDLGETATHHHTLRVKDHRQVRYASGHLATKPVEDR